MENEGRHSVETFGGETLHALPRLDLAQLCNFVERRFEFIYSAGNYSGIHQLRLSYSVGLGLFDETYEFVGVSQNGARGLVVVGVDLL